MPTGMYKRRARGKYGARIFSEEQETFIRENSTNYTAKELADMLGFEYHQISSYLARNVLPRKVKKRNWSKEIILGKREETKTKINRAAFTQYSNRQFK